MLTGQEYSNQLSVGRGKRVSTTIFMVFTEVLKTRKLVPLTTGIADHARIPSTEGIIIEREA